MAKRKSKNPSLIELCDAKGLILKEPAPGHFRILGGEKVVNYYPFSNRMTAYVEGDNRGIKFVTPEKAVELAGNPAPAPTKPAPERMYQPPQKTGPWPALQEAAKNMMQKLGIGKSNS